jgi:hypothetical protein
MKKFTGEICWIGGDYKVKVVEGSTNCKVNRAILTEEGVFKIDHKNPDKLPDGEIKLRTKDSFSYEGSMKYINENIPCAMVNLNLYTNKKNIIFIGTWKEDSSVFTCIIELTEVKEFKD